MVKERIDITKAYTLQFVNKGVGLDLKKIAPTISDNWLCKFFWRPFPTTLQTFLAESHSRADMPPVAPGSIESPPLYRELSELQDSQ